MPQRLIIHQPNELPDHQAILNGAANWDDIFAISTVIDAQWVKTAYERGLFPWYSQGQPVLWHSPEPRMVLMLDDFKTSPSLKKRLRQWARQPNLNVTVNRDFTAVISACADTRTDGTWITDEIKAAYTELHQQNLACSVEVWQDDALVAGLYGVIIGKMFFGESMFTRVTDGSKVALACWVRFLQARGFKMIDCQQETEHLSRLGGAPIDRANFFAASRALMQQPPIQLNNIHNLLEYYA